METDWHNRLEISSAEGIIPPASAAATPAVIWLTGLSGSGKTTLGEIIHDRIQQLRLPVRHLDGDKIRALTPNLGFTKPERMAHIKNVGQLASRLERNGSFVVVSVISPYREARAYARGLCLNFVEVFVSTPLYECARRDAKGLYRKAFAGEIPDFTGVSAPYESPLRPNLSIDTIGVSPNSCAQEILNYVRPYLALKESQVLPAQSARI